MSEKYDVLISELSGKIRKCVASFAKEKNDDNEPGVLVEVLLRSVAFELGYQRAIFSSFPEENIKTLIDEEMINGTNFYVKELEMIRDGKEVQ